MWILPKQLHTSDFVPDTAALSLDSTELSEACARSLFVRSKPSPARTWSAKWRRDSWTQHLSGRILNPSHGQSFVAAWTSSLAVIPASPSAQPESASAQKTLATSGLSSQTEFDFFAPDSASLKMSKATSPSDSERSLESWNQSVTRRRGEYSRRLKSAHRTSASACLSWPSPIASEVRQGFQDRSRGMKGSQESLTTAVVKDAANWPTPNAQVSQDGESPETWLKRKEAMKAKGYNGNGCGTPLTIAVQLHGQAAPANPSTDGSRQGLWQTPKATNVDCPVIHNPQRSDGGQPNLAAQMVLEEKKQWVTPRTSGTSTRPNKTTPRQGLTLIEQAREQEKMWRTPSVAEEKNQNTSTQIYLQNQVGATPKSWATPIMGDSHLASTPEVAQKRIEEGKVTLSRQMAVQWATPRSGKTTDENPETWALRQAKGDVATMPLTAQVKCWPTICAGDYRTPPTNSGISGQTIMPSSEHALPKAAGGKLNPRWVETLMGLPIGWVMPSCASPVTIEPTNCDSSATESSPPPPSEHFEF
jgi:hypothetical protein